MRYIEKTLHEVDSQIWGEFTEKVENSTVFHSLDWLKVISNSYGLKTGVRMIVDKDGIVGALPMSKLPLGNKMVSVPYSDYGGPIIRRGENEIDVTKQMLTGIEKKTNIEIRGPIVSDIFCMHGIYKKHVLDISKNLDEIKRGINKKTILYSVRKAKKNNVVVNVDCSDTSLRRFYMLYLKTRKKHGVPPHSYKFFREIKKYFFDKGNGLLLMAYYGDIPISGGLFLTHKDTVYYKYNVSDIRYVKDKKPNHLLTWESIRLFSDLCFQKFDFGRTFKENKGLNRYKEMWGAKGYDLNYCYPVNCRCSSLENSMSLKVFTFIWKKMPEQVDLLVGPHLMKYIL